MSDVLLLEVVAGQWQTALMNKKLREFGPGFFFRSFRVPENLKK